MKKEEIFKKCLEDKSHVFMIEYFFKTYNRELKDKTPFILFPKQKEYLISLSENNRNIAKKSRQVGLSSVTAAFIACEMVLCDPNKPENILLVSCKQILSQEFLTKVKEYLRQIPRWLWEMRYGNTLYKSDIFVRNNRSEIVLFNNSFIKTIRSINDLCGVSNISWEIFDEPAYIENGELLFTHAMSCLNQENNHILIYSTPNYKDKLFYELYNNALLGKNDYKITDFKWYYDPRYNKNLKWFKDYDEIIEEETDDLGNIHYNEEKWTNLEKEGYKPTSPWYERMCSLLNNDPIKIKQELDGEFVDKSEDKSEKDCCLILRFNSDKRDQYKTLCEKHGYTYSKRITALIEEDMKKLMLGENI